LHPLYDLVDIWSPDRFDVKSDKTAVKYNLFVATGVVGFFGFLYYFAYPEPPAARREYPYGGLYKELGGTDETKELYAVRINAR
jgi:NADH dehydrogenase (ubiquinone) 1 beta subcomplex subunit 8